MRAEPIITALFLAVLALAAACAHYEQARETVAPINEQAQAWCTVFGASHPNQLRKVAEQVAPEQAGSAVEAICAISDVLKVLTGLQRDALMAQARDADLAAAKAAQPVAPERCDCPVVLEPVVVPADAGVTP